MKHDPAPRRDVDVLADERTHTGTSALDIAKEAKPELGVPPVAPEVAPEVPVIGPNIAP